VSNYRKMIAMPIALLATLALSGCGGSDSGSSSANLAPLSVSGRTYNVVIDSGTGFFATQGTSIITTSATENTYQITGDIFNTSDSTGTFEYTAEGNNATLSVQDSNFGEGAFSLVFTDVGTGTYTATVEADPASTQSGVFTEQ